MSGFEERIRAAEANLSRVIMERPATHADATVVAKPDPTVVIQPDITEVVKPDPTVVTQPDITEVVKPFRESQRAADLHGSSTQILFDNTFNGRKLLELERDLGLDYGHNQKVKVRVKDDSGDYQDHGPFVLSDIRPLSSGHGRNSHFTDLLFFNAKGTEEFRVSLSDLSEHYALGFTKLGTEVSDESDPFTHEFRFDRDFNKHDFYSLEDHLLGNDYKYNGVKITVASRESLPFILGEVGFQDGVLVFYKYGSDEEGQRVDLANHANGVDIKVKFA